MASIMYRLPLSRHRIKYLLLLPMRLASIDEFVAQTRKRISGADATLTLARATLDSILMRKTTFPEAVQQGLVKIDENRSFVGADSLQCAMRRSSVFTVACFAA